MVGIIGRGKGLVSSICDFSNHNCLRILMTEFIHLQNFLSQTTSDSAIHQTLTFPNISTIQYFRHTQLQHATNVCTHADTLTHA